jgi:hypothetical protein
MIIELSPAQMLECQEEAVYRAESYVDASRRKNMKDGLSFETVLRYNVDGCMGELACAAGLGYDWTGPDSPSAYDVGGYIEVRSTRYRTGKLIVKEAERDKRDRHTPYVLAIISGSAVRLAGWMSLEDVLDKGYHYWQKGQKFIAVQQADLYDMEILRMEDE